MDLTERILATYRSVPGLRLTTTQAGRLWALDPAQCERLLDALVTDGHLYVDTRGQYTRVGPAAAPPARVSHASVFEAVVRPPRDTCA